MKKFFLSKYLFSNKEIYHLIILTCFVYSTPLLAGKIYKWKDENGVIQFTSTPPEKNIKVTTVGSTKAKVKLDINNAIIGKWNWVDGDEQWGVRIFSSAIEFSHKPRNTSKSERKQGSIIINGKTIEVKYNKHYDLTKVGTVEKFFIVKIKDDMLVLSQLGTHEKLTYRKNDFRRISDKSLSANAKKLLGEWESFDKDRKIRFRNTQFFIQEKEEKRRNVWYYKPRYSGVWTFKDPYIEFDIRTEREEGANAPQVVMKKFKFYIIELNDTILKIRNEHSRIEKFILNGRR